MVYLDQISRYGGACCSLVWMDPACVYAVDRSAVPGGDRLIAAREAFWNVCFKRRVNSGSYHAYDESGYSGHSDHPKYCARKSTAFLRAYLHRAKKFCYSDYCNVIDIVKRHQQEGEK